MDNLLIRIIVVVLAIAGTYIIGCVQWEDLKSDIRDFFNIENKDGRK